MFKPSSRSESATVQPPVRQLPISYIRAFAYHPVAFPQPLAPITTYQVSRNPQTYNANRNIQANGMRDALAQVFQQQFFQDQPPNSFSSQVVPQPSTQQLLPQNPQVEFGTTPVPTTTSTTTTTTTTPAPPTTLPPFSQQIPVHMRYNDGYQRQLPLQQQYQSGNFGGFPTAAQIYSQQYNPFQYNDAPNQFAGRVFSPEPTFQQYTTDPHSYQFIPTSITPIPNNQNNIKFVPCMCPVAVQISPPFVEKRTDEIPILSSPTDIETPSESESSQSSIQETIEETK